MFEGIIKKIVSKYLKEYIENLNPDSLKINLLSGNVDLQNLTLKKTALDELNLPIKIVFGQIGKIHAKIPWQKLSSSPVVIEVFDIFLVLSPKRNDEVCFWIVPFNCIVSFSILNSMTNNMKQ